MSMERKMTLYVFDMDGTLTPPRLPMTEDFALRFHEWQKTHNSFIATGSDYSKVQEQMPAYVINAFTGLYCSMGNVLMRQGTVVRQNEFAEPNGLIKDLEDFRCNTKYQGPLFNNFIERRAGMINFSVLGRDCPYAERERYKAWDDIEKERLHIQAVLQEKYPQLEITVGGSISIDITPQGCGKGQIAAQLRKEYPDQEIVFFGDRTFPGGNDYELASELMKMKNTRVVQVDGPENVLEFLSLQ